MSTSKPHRFHALTRESGGFAMLAVDQREALRLMFAGGAVPEPDGSVNPAVLRAVPDDVLTDFKVAATEELSPYASGVLVDRQFGLDAVVRAGAVDESCGLIMAADEFIPGSGEVVTDSVLDEDVLNSDPRSVGAVAMKLLVVWRPNESAQRRQAMVERFVAACAEAGVLSIIEPVSRAPRGSSEWDEQAWNDGVLAAAKELGDRGADLYKGEVPRHGLGAEDDVRRDCATLTETIDSPWVVLSSGVAPDVFPRAVELACRQGAAGFLAGRAVWQGCVGATDQRASLRGEAVRRLRDLGEIVDAFAHPVH